jgi:tetratricopeptide (TPR) repeat protein/DNA-binding CsgD family transcriptional regulator
MKNSLFIALFFIVASVTAQKKIKTDSLQNLINPQVQDTTQVIILNQLANEFAQNLNQSLEYSNKAYDLASKLHYQRGVAQALRFIGKAYYFSNDHKKYVDYCEQSAAVAFKCKFWNLVTENYESIGSVHLGLWKNYSTALEYYLKALDVYEKYYPTGRIYSPLLGIANVYKEQKEFDQALHYLNKSLLMSEAAKDERFVSICHENMGEINFELKQYDQSKKYFNLALDFFRKSGSEGGQIFCLMGLANVFREQHDLPQALLYGQQALHLSGNFERYERPLVYGNESVGKTYLEMKDFGMAKAHFEKALVVADKLKMSEALRDLHKELSETYLNLNDPGKAYDHHVLYSAYADSLVQSEKIHQLAEMQARFETERKEREIEILRRDKALAQAYYAAAGGVAVVLLVIGLLVLNRQQMKSQTERQLAEKENQILEEKQSLMETELRNKELVESQLHDQLEFKNKELATHTLNLIQKNEILEKIKQNVAEIKSSSEEGLTQKLNGLLSMVNYSLHLDKEWENFKLHFEQVHNGFFKDLIDLYPDLSASDIKLCALVKLNLDNREIAAILNISQDSAKVARHRLRKKLDLAAEQNLISFFNSIGHYSEMHRNKAFQA